MIRVVIRKPLHPYVEEIAKTLGVQDYAEAVNWLILQHKVGSTKNELPHPIANNNNDIDDLQGLL